MYYFAVQVITDSDQLMEAVHVDRYQLSTCQLIVTTTTAADIPRDNGM
jgi:hypothetical protein